MMLPLLVCWLILLVAILSSGAYVHWYRKRIDEAYLSGLEEGAVRKEMEMNGEEVRVTYDKETNTITTRF